MQEDFTHNAKLSNYGRDRVERGIELLHLMNYAIAANRLKRTKNYVEPGSYCLPLPRASPTPSPSGSGADARKRTAAKFQVVKKFLLICFIHPVLLMLRLAEFAALGYSSWVIVAQVVKVRLVAVVAGLNSHLHAVLLHGKFSSLNLYVNIIAGN